MLTSFPSAKLEYNQTSVKVISRRLNHGIIEYQVEKIGKREWVDSYYVEFQ